MKTGILRRLAASVAVTLAAYLASPVSALAMSQTPSSIAAAQRQVDEAQAALDEANAAYGRGSYGFFESVGATSALNALNTATYKSYIVPGFATDATGLDNMLASIKLIERCNELRADNGLVALTLTDYMMATAQADADYSDSVIGHAKQFNVGENLAWNWYSNLDAGSLRAFVQWYDDEKKVYDEAIAAGQQPAYNDVGHYLNIITASYRVSGVAINTKGTLYPTTYAQTFQYSSSEATYTPQAYRTRLQSYINRLNANIETATANLESAQATLAGAWNIENVSVASIGAKTYTGSAIKPALTLTLDGVTLEPGVDYTVSYAANTNAGTATVTITGAGGFTGQRSNTFQIKPASMSSATIATISDQPYDPNGAKPEIPITFNGKSLVAGTDYTVSYANNTILGTATATLTGKGNFTGSTSVTYKVVAADISAATVTAKGMAYSGYELKPDPTVELGETVLSSLSDYSVTYSNNINAGEAIITIRGRGNYTGLATGSFVIERANLERAYVEGLYDVLYTGGSAQPDWKLMLGSKKLGKDDYDVTLVDSVNVGTATMTFTGKGNCTGTKVVQYTIDPASIRYSTVVFEDQVFTGSPLKPTPTVTWGTQSLKSGVDYTITYESNTNVGEVTATLTGVGNFYDTVTGTFNIKPADISTASVTAAEQTYTGGALKPDVTVKLGSKKLKKGTDFTVTFANNTDVGTATIKVTGEGNYTGTARGTFSIKPEDIAKATITTYPMQYTGNPVTPDWYVTMGEKRLEPMQDYTATVSDNVNAGIATITVTGKGNYGGTNTGTYVITPTEIWHATATVDGQVYSGSALRPVPTVSFNGTKLKVNTDFTVSYKNNTNAGEATITVTGKGNFNDTMTVKFPIAPASISEATVAADDQVYTGKPLEPTPTVRLGAKTLKADTDYSVAYADNTEVGTATITVTGKGNYAGEATGTFEIVAKPFFIDADPADDGNHGAEVDWMGRMGISTGWEVTGGREFRGMDNVKRCDFAAFLYRMADLRDNGERDDSIALTDQQVAAALKGVSDCSPEKTSHAMEVAWMINSGISKGWPDKGKKTVSFKPMANVARQDMAAFLYRFADLDDDQQQNQSLKPGSEKVTFKDVKHGDEANHASEVEWLASIGVTKGWLASGDKFEFRGTKTVARQDMAAFMQRLYGWLNV